MEVDEFSGDEGAETTRRDTYTTGIPPHNPGCLLFVGLDARVGRGYPAEGATETTRRDTCTTGIPPYKTGVQ